MSEDNWYDEAAGPLVRPYTITSGRTPSGHAPLDVSTQVMSLRTDSAPRGLAPEHLTIVQLCRRPLSIAEVAAYVKLPLGVVRVLCADLIDRGLVITRAPSHKPAQAPDHETLQAVLDGLIKL